jgi:hypothetical protein
MEMPLMGSQNKPNNPEGNERGFFAFIRRLFSKGKPPNFEHPLRAKDNFHLEPRYWVEVKHFMDTIELIVKEKTIDDSNVQILNQRILDYIEQQINVKGSLPDIEQRYMALNTLADRILVNNLSKFVGLKHTPNTAAEFTSAIDQFKRDLEKRHQEELAQLPRKN